MIPRRPFGASGIETPVLGFGVSGPHATGLAPRARTIQLVEQALEGGATLFDTAPFYGEGEAERRLGEALHGVRDGALVCTKAGTLRTPQGLAKDFSPAFIAASVELSLARLRAGRIDLLLLHGPAPEHLTDELRGAAEALKAAGKIRLVGVCGRGPELDAAIEAGWLDAIMIPVNRAAAEAAGRWAGAARERGMGVLGIETMGAGRPGWRPPRSAADLWYLARAARRHAQRAPAPRRAHAPAAPPSPAQELEWALASGLCDCAVATTTRPRHLAANLDIARAAP